MDVNETRAILTALSLFAFLGIAVWAYSRHNKARFDEAANLPFADDEMDQRSATKSTIGNNPGANNG